MGSRTRQFLIAIAATNLLAACGGGGTDATGSATLFSQGVMTKGSIILNGVRFEDRGAVVRIDDRTTSAVELASGMVVKLRGRVNADGTTGVAERVEVEKEVRGPISAINAAAQPASFVVVGQTVLIDSTTIYANVSGFGALALGMRVEVHGQRDANGAIRASRVELAAPGLADELKGTAANLTATTFTLGTVTVNFAGATITPTGAMIAVGQPVEAHGSFNATTGVFVATRVDREDLEDAQVQPGNGEKLEVEGFVTALNGSTSTFVVNGRTVRHSSATRFEGGSAADLANNVKVEAEGPTDAGGELLATRIEFKQSRVTVQGVASAVDVTARRVTVLGVVVRVDDLTEVRAVDASSRDSTRLSDIVANVDRVEVRGRLDSTGAFIAERLEETADRDDELRGRVSAANEPARTLVVLGVNVSAAGAVFRDANDAPISAAAFFTAITPTSATTPGTTVQVKGVFAGGTLTASAAKLEN